MIDLVIAFAFIAKDIRADVVEAWLTQKETGENKIRPVTDYEMDMLLIEAKKDYHTFSKLAKEFPEQVTRQYKENKR